MDERGMNEAIAVLDRRKESWARLSIREKIAHLEALRARTDEVAEDWVGASVNAKRIPKDSPPTGEEWLSGPWALLRALNQLIGTLGAIDEGDSPLRDLKRHMRADGQVVLNVFPRTLYDRMLLNGFSAEVWMQPELTIDDAERNAASFYRGASHDGRVALVLGAGNIASIPPLDVLYKMFSEGMACLLKMNPVNDYLGPFFEKIFSSLMDAGFVRFAYGGPDVGAFLVAHAGIDEVHVTGDYRTYNAIVYGPGEEGERRRQRDEPLITKRVTAELGNVTPTIVIPGPWSDADIAYQAEHVVTQKMHNAAFNCIAAQVLVMPKDWDRGGDFLDAIRTTMRRIPAREAYYPGAAQRQSDILAQHPDVEWIEPETGPRVKRALITELDAANADEYCFNKEFFANVLSMTTLPGATAAEFLEQAVRFCNDSVWGTLGVNLILHPKTMRELASAFDKALADLRYGCIGINAWVGVGFLLSETPWGAFPGHARNDIRSGSGVAHNFLLLDKPQKTVVRQPFYPFPRNLAHGEIHFSPKPAWFVTNKKADVIAERITRFEARPRLGKLPGIFSAALRG